MVCPSVFFSPKNMVMDTMQSTVYPSFCLCLVKLVVAHIESHQSEWSPASHDLQPLPLLKSKGDYFFAKLQVFNSPWTSEAKVSGHLIWATPKTYFSKQFNFPVVQCWNFPYFPYHVFCKRGGEKCPFLDSCPEPAFVFKGILPCLAKRFCSFW